MPRKLTPLTIGTWVVSILAAFAFIAVGGSKLAGAPAMRELFTQVGIGQWFRYVTGGLEVLGGVLLLIPSRAFWGALLLACIMVGAILTHLTILHTPPTGPVVLLASVSFIAWARRPAPQPGSAVRAEH